MGSGVKTIKLTSLQILNLMFVAASLAAGQILFKSVANTIYVGDGSAGFLRALVSWQFFAAITLYGVSTLLWVHALMSIPLSQAYPFMALGFVLVPLAAYFVYGEQLDATYWMGVAALLVGLYLITSGGA